MVNVVIHMLILSNLHRVYQHENETSNDLQGLCIHLMSIRWVVLPPPELLPPKKIYVAERVCSHQLPCCRHEYKYERKKITPLIQSPLSQQKGSWYSQKGFSCGEKDETFDQLQWTKHLVSRWQFLYNPELFMGRYIVALTSPNGRINMQLWKAWVQHQIRFDVVAFRSSSSWQETRNRGKDTIFRSFSVQKLGTEAEEQEQVSGVCRWPEVFHHQDTGRWKQHLISSSIFRVVNLGIH